MRRYLLALLLFGCTDPPAPTPLPATQPSLAAVQPQAPEAPKAPDTRLGGGYRDAKWGMSRKQIRGGVIKGKVTLQDKESIGVDLPGGKTLLYEFYQDQLSMVTFCPHFTDEKADRAVLIETMEQKYGPGLAVTGTEFMLAVAGLQWRDDETQIDVKWYLPGQRIGRVSFGDSTRIVYTSMTLFRQQMADQVDEQVRQRKALRADIRQHL